MPVGDKQRLITSVLEQVLGVKAQYPTFAWLKNKHLKADFGPYYSHVDHIFKQLGGEQQSNLAKREIRLTCDAYFGEPYNFMFEFDEFQHFSTSKLKALRLYPEGLALGFDLEFYKDLCMRHKQAADKYRSTKVTTDFPFIGGRTAQRAYLDCFRDFLPTLHGLNPTLRISEFEVNRISVLNTDSNEILRALLRSRLVLKSD